MLHHVETTINKVKGLHHSEWINHFYSYISLHSVHSKTFLLHTQHFLKTKQKFYYNCRQLDSYYHRNKFPNQASKNTPYSSMIKIRGFRSWTHTLSTEQQTPHWKLFLTYNTKNVNFTWKYNSLFFKQRKLRVKPSRMNVKLHKEVQNHNLGSPPFGQSSTLLFKFSFKYFSNLMHIPCVWPH